MQKSTLLLVILVLLFSSACKTNGSEQSSSPPVEAPGVVKAPSEESEASSEPSTEPESQNLPAKDLPGDPDPEADLLPFPEREFEGSPLREEHHQTRVFWTGDKTRLTTCKAAFDPSDCSPHGPILEPGEELTWKYSVFRVKPRLLSAKHEVEMHIHGMPMTLKAGTVVALYTYQGEGTCAVATGHLYDEATTCPLREDFDNYPPDLSTTAKTLAPADYTWWVQRDEGWVHIRPELVRINFESTL